MCRYAIVSRSCPSLNRYPARLYEILYAYARGPKDLAVDVACGSGQCATVLAQEYTSVIGIDPSENQLASAEQADIVAYRKGSAEDLRSLLADGSVDLLTVAQALHWCFPHRCMPCRMLPLCFSTSVEGVLTSDMYYGTPWWSSEIITVLVSSNPAAPENRSICFPPAGQSPQAILRVYGSVCMQRSPSRTL